MSNILDIYPAGLTDRSLNRFFHVASHLAPRKEFCRNLEAWLGREKTRRRVLQLIDAGQADADAAPPEPECFDWPDSMSNREVSETLDVLDTFATTLGGRRADVSMLQMLGKLEEATIAMAAYRLERADAC